MSASGQFSSTRTLPRAKVGISLPATWKDKSEENQRYWQKLNYEAQIFSIADGYVLTGTGSLTPDDSITWMSLHSLAVALMNGHCPRPPIYLENKALDFILADSQWTDVRREFFAERNNRFNAMRHFLKEWKIGHSETNPFYVSADSKRNDEKILGLFEFTDKSQVENYILRWQENPNLINDSLRQHRCILSRAIDLICSEIVDNAFTHSHINKDNEKVRILSKICTVESCKVDLDLDVQWKHLSCTERDLYTLCFKNKIPHLQLLIADDGRGFDKNEELLSLWRKEYSQSRIPSIDELIKFAIRGDITTKSSQQINEALLHSVEKEEHYRPEVHGLSEVFYSIKQLQGLWRIHSGNTCVEFSALDKSKITVKDAKVQAAMHIKGCLHYFAIPLRPYEEPVTARPLVMFSPGFAHIASQSNIIDISKCLKIGNAKNTSEQYDGFINFDKDLFRNFFNKIKPESKQNLNIYNLRGLTLLSDGMRLTACASVLDHILRRGADAIPILIGLDLVTLSTFRRFLGPKNFIWHAKVIIAFLWYEAHNASSVELILGADAQKVSNELTKLMTRRDYEIVKSESEHNTWNTFVEVVAKNHLLFRMMPYGRECFIRLNIPFPLDIAGDSSILFLTNARVSFQTLKYLIKQTNALIKDTSFQLIRLGQKQDYYMHIGRLVADPAIRDSILRCCSQHLLERKLFEKIANPKNLVILGLLHPAIEIAHALGKISAFTNADVATIRHRSEIRFDHQTLVALEDKNIVIIVDMIYTGALIKTLLCALNRLNVKVLSIFAILDAHPDHQLQEIPINSYCSCDKKDIQSL